MKPSPGSGAVGSESIASPAIIVLLVLLMGGTLYLWRQRYMRRRTAFTTLAVLGILLAIAGYFTYLNRF